MGGKYVPQAHWAMELPRWIQLVIDEKAAKFQRQPANSPHPKALTGASIFFRYPTTNQTRDFGVMQTANQANGFPLTCYLMVLVFASSVGSSTLNTVPLPGSDRTSMVPRWFSIRGTKTSFSRSAP